MTVLISTFLLLLVFINVPNSFSISNNEVTRIGLLDDLCKNNPLCDPFSRDTQPPTSVQSENKSVTGTLNQNATGDGTLLTYRNNTLGLEIQYPMWLNKTDNERGIEFVFPNKSAGAILAASNVEPTARNNSVMSHLLHLNKSLDNLHILNTSRSDIMGYPTPTILFTYDNNTELYKGVQFWKIEGGQAHLFTYFAPADRVFNEWLPTIDRMLKTIKIS